MSFPPYKNLLTYRYTEIIHDLTVVFCQKYINPNDYRTKDQMTQAARSGKQNIIEGIGQSRTSKKGEIKLLGVAKSSLEELLGDYEDFLRQHYLEILPKTDSRILSFRQYAFRLTSLNNLSSLGNLIEKASLPNSSLLSANLLLTLCHQATYLLDKQIKKAESDFIQKGGYTENLFKRRLNSRISQNAPIAQLDRAEVS